MAITKDKKMEISEKVSDILKSAKIVVFVNFHGLSVTDSNELRKKLRGENVGYYVAKKTLIKKELEKQVGPDVPNLDGEVALAYLSATEASGSDDLAPARIIYEASGRYKNSIKILGGIFENKYTGSQKMTEIAMIPTKNTLLGMLVNLINSPIQGLALALDQIAKSKLNSS